MPVRRYAEVGQGLGDHCGRRCRVSGAVGVVGGPGPRPPDVPPPAAAGAAAAGVVAKALTDLGTPPDRHVDLIRTLRAILHGFVDLENGHGFGLSDPVDASFEAALDLFVSALRAQ